MGPVKLCVRKLPPIAIPHYTMSRDFAFQRWFSDPGSVVSCCEPLVRALNGRSTEVATLRSRNPPTVLLRDVQLEVRIQAAKFDDTLRQQR